MNLAKEIAQWVGFIAFILIGAFYGACMFIQLLIFWDKR